MEVKRMKQETLSSEDIRNIAREVTEGYNPVGLPSLEEISWAFPVEGQEAVHYHRRNYINRIPNIQEGNALSELMTFKNFHNLLQYLSEEGANDSHIPDHTHSIGDADDGAYMVYPYLAIKNKKEGKEDAPVENGFFWENISEELVKSVLRVEGTGRGAIVDEWGNQVERKGNIAYVDEDLTRQYLQNVKESFELGSEYFNQVVQSSDQAGNYPQLNVANNVENWQEGDEFQWGLLSNGEPALWTGQVRSNDGEKLHVEIGNKKINRSYNLDLMKAFEEEGSLWKLIRP